MPGDLPRVLAYHRVRVDHEARACVPEYLQQTARTPVVREGLTSFLARDIVEVGEGEYNPDSKLVGGHSTVERFALIRLRGDATRVQVYESYATVLNDWLIARMFEEEE